MGRGRTLLLASVVAAMATVTAPVAPVAASHELEELQVIVALNAAGGDKISVLDLAATPPDGYEALASEVAVSLDSPEGSFRTSEDFDGGYAHPDAKLAQPDDRGRLRWSLDTGKLQVLAQQEGYEAVIVVVCTPQVRQLVTALVAPQEAPFGSPGSRCRGWYQEVDDPSIRAVVELVPDRGRYPRAVLRVVGTAAIAFGVLGLAATLLRRGPLRRRSLASWLLSVGAALAVAPLGWTVTSVALWITGPAADPMLLGGGTDAEQVARTLLPGLAFLLPALLPAVILLSAARRPAPAPPGPVVAAGPPVPMWWPTSWWGHWAASGGPQAPATPPAPPPAGPPPAGPPALAPPPGSGSGWVPPGAGGG